MISYYLMTDFNAILHQITALQEVKDQGAKIGH